METGTQEGCIYKENGLTCRKLTERGSNMCPHHNLLQAYKDEQKAALQAAKEKEQSKKPVRGVKRHAEQHSYYKD